jgi:hypothetical protein
MATAFETHLEASLLADMLAPAGEPISAEAAKVILSLQFSAAQRERMRLLAERAQEGVLTGDERYEAECFQRLGSLLGTMQSRARQQLSQPG